MTKRIVIALGGNALQRDGEASAAAQERVAKLTARTLVPLIQQGVQIVLVHGNGPQVGNIVLHEEAINTKTVPTMPLDVNVAMSQGQIGFWLQNALINEFTRQHMDATAATVVTQMLVDANDPAFNDPTKPIGPFYATESEAKQAANKRGFVYKQDAGRGYRRMVPSPRPVCALEEYTVQKLIDNGVTVITAGGGGIPVVQTPHDGYKGVEAVIDKDFAAAVIAKTIHADELIILTAVDAVMIGFGTPQQQALRTVTVAELEQYINDEEFAAGSMLPKVLAAAEFCKQTGCTAVIGSLEHAIEVIAGTSGTHIVK